MALRFRLYPTAEQTQFMLERHCADARFVWNLAVGQFNWGRSGRPAPGSAERQRQLAEARQAFGWLWDGSSSVQQQALRDFDRAAAGFFNCTPRRPTWRRKHAHEGFCVRDTKVRVHNRKWAEVAVPKLGWGCAFAFRAHRRDRWAWRGSPATRQATGMSVSPPHSPRFPTPDGPVGQWGSIAVWPQRSPPPMVRCCVPRSFVAASVSR